jgi:hypothetical protein
MWARPEDPEIGVHVLTEFVFCPRAGLCIYEENLDDTGEELFVQANLDYMPRYDLHQIEDALRRIWGKMWAIALAGLAVVALSGLLAWLVEPEAIWLGFVGMAGAAWKIKPLFKDAMRLAWRQRQCLTAKAREPDRDSMEIQKVNWWELLHAGFRSIAYKDNLPDHTWKLRGRPKRVLLRGSDRIPVFFMRHGEARIYPQHKVRMAAYCHLLRECEVAQSPYGIVIFPESYEGVAIPNSPGTRKLFHDALVTARGVVLKSREPGGDPEPPTNPRLCARCHVGKPRMHRPGETEHRSRGQILAARCAQGVDGRDYHSHCGDRFGWIPPHEKAREKQLWKRSDWEE